MLDQILAQGAEIEFENVISVEDMGDTKVVKTEEGGVYEGSAVVLATGVKHRMLGIEGEEELVGEGISFCAVCDGDFYSGRRVCVAGGGNSALQEAVLLSEKCSEVIMLQDLDFFTGEQRLQDVLFAKPNVRAFTGVGIKRFLVTDGELCGLEIEEKRTGEKRTVACDGLFVAIGLIPENEPYKALADVNEYGYFDADERCLTKTPGIFVAGDCRSKTVRQLTTAVADGASAALAACRYMQMR
jgi:thioredoxin reductase (NADPH)